MIIGSKTIDGDTIANYSNHPIVRIFGAMHDESHNGIKHGIVTTSKKGINEYFR